MDIPPLRQITGLGIGEQLVNIIFRLGILDKDAGLTAKAVLDKYADDASADDPERAIMKKMGDLVIEASRMYDPPDEGPQCSTSP